MAVITKTSRMQSELFEALSEALDIKEGQTVADLGAGNGLALPFISSYLKQQGQVIAIDNSEHSLRNIEENYSDLINKNLLETLVHDLKRPLPFADHSISRILCHNVLECLNDKIAFINECYRVLEPGGKLVMSHNDFDTIIFNSSFSELTRKLVHNYADTKQDWQEFADGQMGRKLYGIFSDSKFTEYENHTMALSETDFQDPEYGFKTAHWIVEIAQKVGSFDQQELTKWLEDLKSLSKKDAFFFSINVNYVFATKS